VTSLNSAELRFPVASKPPEELEKAGFVATTSTQEIFEASSKLVRQWEPSDDTFYLRWSPSFAGVMATFLGGPVFRNTLKANKIFSTQAKFTSVVMFVNVVPSAVFAYALHQYSITRGVFMGEPPCSVCREIRAVGYQLVPGVLFTSGMSLFAAAIELKRSSIVVKNWPQWTWKMLNRNRGTMVFAMACQSAAIAGLHYKEESEWLNINQELLKRVDYAKKHNLFHERVFDPEDHESAIVRKA